MSFSSKFPHLDDKGCGLNLWQHLICWVNAVPWIRSRHAVSVCHSSSHNISFCFWFYTLTFPMVPILSLVSGLIKLPSYTYWDPRWSAGSSSKTFVFSLAYMKIWIIPMFILKCSKMEVRPALLWPILHGPVSHHL